MKLSVVALLLATVGFYLVHASDVVVLNAGNFDSKISSGTWMVKFYAPWCGHCKNMIPAWESFASDQVGTTNVAKVDCTVERALAEKFGIRGFPTLKMIKDGKVYDFSGPRTPEVFKEFVESGYENAPSTQLSSLGGAKSGGAESAPSGNEEDIVVLEASTFSDKTSQGAWLVKFYAPWCGHCKRLAPTWASLATHAKENEKDYSVAKVDCTQHQSVCQDFGVRGYPTIKLIKDSKVYDFKGKRTVDAFDKFAISGFTGATPSDVPNSGGAKQEL